MELQWRWLLHEEDDSKRRLERITGIFVLEPKGCFVQLFVFNHGLTEKGHSFF